VHPYIRRKRGEEDVHMFHPAVEPILGRTLGVPLFQEQAMQLAMVVAQFTAAEADALRRAMGGQRHRHRLDLLLDKLRAGMRSEGVHADYIERVIQQIHGFSNFGFPESHSTSFALIVYASCWLKHRYPAEFLCAMLNAQPLGFYSPAALIYDARRHGVEVRPPCLQNSDWRTQMEGDAVRLGLRLVKGLGTQSQRRLQAAREHGVFTSAEDAVRRIDLPQRAWCTLAESGAFDAFIQPRRQALWTILRMTRYTQFALPLGMPSDTPVTLPEQTPLEQTAADYRSMGLSTGRHPVTYLRPMLNRRGVLRADQLLSLRDKQWVRVAGQVNTRQKPPSAKGFFFITLEDETGFINVIVRPQVFEARRRLLVSAPFMYIEGVLGLEQGVANVQGRIFEELGFGEVTVPKARSFK
jgi:error-prone DNA polymerase